MKVSVIVAAYNIEDYIERCINSVINQSFSDIEIIVVNDGSTDSTLEKLNKLKNYDKRIKIINKENEGLIEARKTGFKNSVGDYLLFIDGDDFLELNAINDAYLYASRYSFDIVCFNSFKAYDEYKLQFDTFYNEEIVASEPLTALLLDKILPAIWAKMIKREFIIKNQIKFPSNISYGEDLATVANWFMHNPKIGLLNKNLYNYYQRSNSITASVSSKVLEVNQAIEFIKIQLIEKDMYYAYKEEFEYMVFTHLFKRIVIDSEVLNDITNKVYFQYKKYNIHIFNNKYIDEYIFNQTISMKYRMLIYNFNYKLGKVYDFIRVKVKKYIRK